uniref:NOT2/NOT3/NOT5 C-terminal domain-containing protein n=1 Tax=Globodera rostochiensis TaxID=31243 RepID=A0A914H2Z2_GLORO
MLNDDDFPALPNSALQSNQSQQIAVQQRLSSHIHQSNLSGVNNDGTNARLSRMKQQFATENTEKVGIQTHPDGRVTNIPPGMLNDQFGMAGLLTFLRTIEGAPSIVGLALGHDLTNLGLNLNSSKRNLFQTFGGPWADFPCRIQDLDAKVPDEYLTNATIRDKLPHIKMQKLHEDVLFYLFYNCPGEVYQVAAASELYVRDWRFHKVERVWLMRAPFSAPPREIGGTYERCSYLVFDPVQWRRIPREMVLEYKDLEGKPSVSGTGQSSSVSTGTLPPVKPESGAEQSMFS